MLKNINGWERNSNGAGDEIDAANRALASGERKVWDANFAYQMALASGDPAKISAAEAGIKQSLAEDIRRKGGRYEDVLLMQRFFHGNGNSSGVSRWLVVLGLGTFLYFLMK